jgi:NADH:ubiquinone oxidoreductase subunit 2 (subunit N)
VLAAAMAVNTVIALFYYVNVVVQMAFKAPPDEAPSVEVPALIRTALAVSAVVVVVVGILPNLFNQLADASTLL